MSKLKPKAPPQKRSGLFTLRKEISDSLFFKQNFFLIFRRMNAALFYLPYLPSVSWWVAYLSHSPAYIEREEHFEKATARNRCEVAGANGRILLSIPLEGGREQRVKYREMRISFREPWQRVHWGSIYSAYGSTPFFEHYADGLRPFYEKRLDYLFDFNVALLQWCFQCLRLQGEPVFTETYQRHPEQVVDLRRESFRSSENLPRYYQVFEDRHGFMPGLSIIDLLFHLGPEAGDYLRSGKVEK